MALGVAPPSLDQSRRTDSGMGESPGREPFKNREVIRMKYLATSWQGFLQFLVYAFGRGYFWYCHTVFPERKKSKWESIDQKLIERYKADLSKFQRARKKKKGIMNFLYIRWSMHSVILHSKGVLDPEIEIQDPFKDIRKNPLEIKISEDISMSIYKTDQKGFSVKLSKETYKGFKAVIWDSAKTQNKDILLKEWAKLNGIPSWKGVIEQKKRLAKYALKQGRKHQIKVLHKDFRINTYRKVYKIWD